MNIEYCAEKDIEFNDDEIEFDGNLTISCSTVNKMPKKLIVHGNFNLWDSKVDTLPNDLIVDTLYVSNANITHLPKHLKAKNILIEYCPAIDNLGEELESENSITLKSLKISNLPVIKCKSLHIWDCDKLIGINKDSKIDNLFFIGTGVFLYEKCIKNEMVCSVNELLSYKF